MEALGEAPVRDEQPACSKQHSEGVKSSAEAVLNPYVYACACVWVVRVHPCTYKLTDGCKQTRVHQFAFVDVIQGEVCHNVVINL